MRSPPVAAAAESMNNGETRAIGANGKHCAGTGVRAALTGRAIQLAAGQNQRTHRIGTVTVCVIIQRPVSFWAETVKVGVTRAIGVDGKHRSGTSDATVLRHSIQLAA